MARKTPSIDREELDRHVERVARQFKAVNFVILALSFVLFMIGVMIGLVRAAHGIK
jgi:predicted nuclease with RNAse H fold